MTLDEIIQDEALKLGCDLSMIREAQIEGDMERPVLAAVGKEEIPPAEEFKIRTELRFFYNLFRASPKAMRQSLERVDRALLEESESN